MEPDELKDFAYDLFRHGVSVLPCGGGVTTQPLRAIRELRGTYGADGLVRLSIKLLCGPSLSDDLPEGVDHVALGLLYHLADAAVLQQLLDIRKDWAAEQGRCGSQDRRRALLLVETGISGICSRLKFQYPDGIEPLDMQVECYLFWAES